MEKVISKFSGYPLTRWCKENDRNMILEEVFYYLDKKGKKWIAPIGGELNGATIPKILWSIVGSPFIGKYRRASVVHDYFVGEGNNPDVTFKERRRADKMFFRACRTDNCPWTQAVYLYIGASVGSWASRNKLKHSLEEGDLKSMAISDDYLIEKKYNDLKAKVDSINLDDDFEALEKFINTEIE